MRTLWLLRHAKSSWDELQPPDRERPLAKRGVRAARRIAAHVGAEGIRPAVVLCSPARRARETFAALQSALGEGTDVRFVDALYGATASGILDVVHGLERDVESAMVVGHNPGLQDLAIELAAGGDKAALTRLHAKFPTGGLATLRFATETWDDVGRRRGELAALVVPRELEAG